MKDSAASENSNPALKAYAMAKKTYTKLYFAWQLCEVMRFLNHLEL